MLWNDFELDNIKIYIFSYIFDIQETEAMKAGKKHLVPTDEDYIGNFNLVTGAKFNYDKQLSTQNQIKELCIDQRSSKTQKFLRIIRDGQKIQKWSVFENMKYYCSSSSSNNQSKNSGKQSDSQKIIQTLSKSYTDLIDFLPIMGEGILALLSEKTVKISKKSYLIIQQMAYRTLTQYPAQIGDWQEVFDSVAKHCGKQQIQKYQQYIRGAFEMNSPPEKRRSAMIMIHGLFEHSNKISNQAHTKVLFFNSDQNPKTRETIAKLMHKILLIKPNDEQVWKQVWQYYNDKQQSIKQKAVKIIFSIYYKNNLKNIYNSILVEEMQGQVIEKIIITNFSKFLRTYSADINKEMKYQMEIIAFCNRIIKNNRVENVCTFLDSVYDGLVEIMGQAKVFSEISFSSLQLKETQIIAHLFQIYENLTNIEFKQNIKITIFRALKQQKYAVYHKINFLAPIFQLSLQDQISIYYTMCNKFLQNSKWHQLSDLLSVFHTLKLYQNMYDKFCLLILKICLSSPSFLLPLVIQCMVYLMLLNKRSLEFLITVRQKLVNAKSWSYRSNYIMLYTAIKMETSFEYHKLVPILMYKNIVMEKSYGVKLTFLKSVTTIYKHTEPENTSEKSIIRETVNKLVDDKDKYVRNAAQDAKKHLQKLDRESHYLHELYRRNQQLVEKQQISYQVITDPKRTIKTENQIRKSLFKKKNYLNENRRTTNTIRDNTVGIHKDVSIDSLSYLPSSKIKLSEQSKDRRTNLFRCHSVKIKVPNSKKK